MTTQRELVEGGARNGGSANGQCSRGWAKRCATSRGRKCTCACGGTNHGKARGSLGSDVTHTTRPRRAEAQYDIVAGDERVLVIRDVGHDRAVDGAHARSLGSVG